MKEASWQQQIWYLQEVALQMTAGRAWYGSEYMLQLLTGESLKLQMTACVFGTTLYTVCS